MRALAQLPAARVTVLLVLVVAFFLIAAPGFGDSSTVHATLLTAAPALLFAAGMTFVVVAGGIDLSVGSTAALASVVSVALLDHGVAVAVVGGVAVGVAVGLINGLLVVVLRVNSLIATLATMIAIRGVVLTSTDSQAISASKIGPSIYVIKDVLTIFTPMTLIALAIVALCHLVLARSRAGRDLYAIGGNEAAAVAAGVPINRRLVLAFALSGATAGVAGTLLGFQLGSGSPILGQQAALTAVAAVVIGGGALTGGTGGVPGTVLGVLTLTTLTTGLVAIDVPPTYQQVITGAILVVVVVGATFGRLLRPVLDRRRSRPGGAAAAPARS